LILACAAKAAVEHIKRMLAMIVASRVLKEHGEKNRFMQVLLPLGRGNKYVRSTDRSPDSRLLPIASKTAALWGT
jgi:hypothetical protein